MPAIDAQGRLKKNPLLGQAFGAGAAGQAQREAYTGLHSALRQYVAGGGKSLADYARARFEQWGSPREAEIKRRQRLASSAMTDIGNWTPEYENLKNTIAKSPEQQAAFLDLENRLSARRSALAGHQAAITSGTQAYQSRQNLYNRFFGRGVY